MRITRREMIRATFKSEQQKNTAGLRHGTGSMAEFKRFFYYRRVGGSPQPPCLFQSTSFNTSLYTSGIGTFLD